MTASYRVGAYPDRRTSLPRSACTPSPGRLPRSACRAYPDRRTGRTSRPELTRPQSVCQCLNSWRGGGSPRHHRRLSGGCGTEPHPGFVARKAASGGPFRRTPRGGVVPSRSPLRQHGAGGWLEPGWVFYSRTAKNKGAVGPLRSWSPPHWRECWHVVKMQEKNRQFRVFLLQVPKALASNGFWTILASTRRACLGPGRDGKVFCDSKLRILSLPRSAY